MNEIQIFIPLFPSVPAARQKKDLLKRLKIHFVNLLQTFFQACTIIRKRQKVYQVSLISSKNDYLCRLKMNNLVTNTLFYPGIASKSLFIYMYPIDNNRNNRLIWHCNVVL